MNVSSMLKSTLTPDQYLICLLIHKKEFSAVKQIVLRLFGYCDSKIGEVYSVLEEDGWIKINGDKLPEDIEVRWKFLELLKDSSIAPAVDIISWVDEYRELFKGKKPGAIGDRDMCIKHLQWLFTNYPEYTKDDVMKAAKYYISTCAKDGYKYLVRSHYFLSKEDTKGVPVHQVLTYLEETEDESFNEPQDFVKSI